MGYQGGGSGGFTGGFTDPQDLFSNLFGDLFGDVFRGGRSRSRGPAAGDSLRIRLNLSLIEAADGVTKQVQLNRREVCEKCKGTRSKSGKPPAPCGTCGGAGEVAQSQGFFSIRTACPHCRGEGTIIPDPCRPCRGSGLEPKAVEVSVEVPPGVDTGHRLRVQGEGEAALRGGPRGDLYCDIEIEPNQEFTREGDHLRAILRVGFPEVALGASREIPTLNGTVDLKIPAGTQSGEILRLRRQGMPQIRGNGRGDLFVQIQVETPRKLSREQKKLLAQLSESLD